MVQGSTEKEVEGFEYAVKNNMIQTFVLIFNVEHGVMSLMANRTLIHQTHGTTHTSVLTSMSIISKGSIANIELACFVLACSCDEHPSCDGLNVITYDNQLSS